MRGMSSISTFLFKLFRRKRPIHLIVDGDQLAEGITQNAIAALAGAGYVPVQPIKVFCNQHGTWRWKETLHEYDMTEVPDGKDMADAHIILECGKLLATSKLKTIGVLSGDSIFAAAATAIKNNGGIPILLAPASKANFQSFAKSRALCFALDDKPNEALLLDYATISPKAVTQPKKIKKNSSVWHRRNRAINRLKKEPLPLSLELLEEVANVACAEREGEPTLRQMLQDHPDVRLTEKAGVQYAVHIDHDGGEEGNVVSISG